jgi:predicted RNA-binding Zn ribbon-like protein
VIFTHDTEASLTAAVALVNSAEPPDTLTSQEALDAFYVEHAYTGSRTRSPVELDEVRALRAPLRELLTSGRDQAVEIVNRMLAEHRAVPQLVRHDEEDWHIHGIGRDAPFAARIAVETALAMVDVIRADEMSRLGTCAGDDCEGIVLDLSRNRSRRFCSTACGNRSAVAAYRARQTHGG